MSNPDNESDTQEEQETADDAVSSFADVVNKAVEGMTKDAKGNYVLPEDLPEEVKVAATFEKRRRDTQAEYTRLSQENKALKAEKSVLLSKASEDVTITLTAEQTEELEELKFSDPEAWRKKMNAYERDARNKRQQDIADEVKKVSTSSLEQDEIDRRRTVLEEFLEANEGFNLNDDIIANDIPPRITKKLADGKVTFEEFLQECLDYTKTGKVVKQEKAGIGPNLGKVGGGSTPDKHAVKEDIITSYSKETY